VLTSGSKISSCESINDSALDARLAPYASTRMNPKQLAQAFPSDGVIHQIIAGKRPMPTDPVQKLIYSVNVARIESLNSDKAVGSVSVDPAKQDANVGSESVVPSPQDQARTIADSLLAYLRISASLRSRMSRPNNSSISRINCAATSVIG